jgi:signal transduction histidine kinase
VLVVSLEGQILASNRASQLLFTNGESRDGEPLASSVRESSRASIEAVFTEAKTTGYALRRSVEVEFEDGLRLPVGLSASLVAASEQSPSAIVLVVQDLTVDRELAAFAREETRRTDLIAEASHEIRNPMTAVLGTLEVLLAGALPAPDRKLAGFAHNEAKRILLLVRDILDSQRLGGKDDVLDRSSFDVALLIAEAVAGVRAVIPQALVRVEVEPGLPLLKGDRPKLDRVVRNLVENALKYSPDGAEVVVTARRIDEALELLVLDRGIGIPADEVSRVFEKFYRTTATRRRKIPGHGLGLAMVKTIVEAHDGVVAVKSEPGKGSTFSVRLPLAA